MSKPLDGRTAVITGASQGLGLAIARAYVEAGASVMMCAREAARLEDARDDVAARAELGQRVVARCVDVSQPEDVEALAAAAGEMFDELHVLVSNAGVYGPIGAVECVDWKAWVDTIAINLLGSVLLCRAFVPRFKARRYGKIVQLSGGGATTPLPRFTAYAASKAAVVRFAESLAEEVRADRIDVNCIAPGPLNTRMLDEVLAAGPDRAGDEFYGRSLKQKHDGGAPLELGADLAVFLGSAASDGITGKLVSAVWDPWQEFDRHREDLDRTDLYTLRRISPNDRRLPWGGR